MMWHDTSSHLENTRRPWPWWMSVLFAVFVLLYFYELSNFTLSIDEELAMYREDSRVWIAQGRWGIYLIERFLLPNPATPVVPLALLGALLAAAATQLFSLFNVDAVGLRILGFALIAGFPTTFMLAEFSTNVVPVGLAMLGAVLCAKWSRDHGAWPTTLLLIVLASILSLYQSVLFLVVVLCLGLALQDIQYRDAVPRAVLWRLIRTGILLLAGIALYAAVNKMALAISGTRAAYVQSYFDLYFPTREPDLVWDRIRFDVDRLYFGRWEKGFRQGPAQFALVALAGTVMLHALRPRTRIDLGKSSMGVALLTMIMLTPFALHVFSPWQVPYRSMLAVPFAMWLLVMHAYRSVASITIKKALITLLALTVLHNWQSLNQFFHASKTVGLHDQIIATRLSERIAQVLPPTDSSAPVKIVVSGALRFDNGYSFKQLTTTAGSSFFEWDHGNPDRIAKYLRYLGLGNFRRADPELEARLMPLAKALPVWPADGCVARVEDTVLIHFPNSSDATSR